LYKLAIFDFDGTLVDSAPGIVDVMRDVVIEYNLGDELLHQWSLLIGVPLLRQAEILFPDKSPGFHEELANRYRAIYDTKIIEICPLFPGLLTMLRRLSDSDVFMSIASSKRRHLIDTVLEHHNLSQYFKMVVGAQDVENHKPHPESVLRTVKDLNIPLAQTVVIGDSSFDLDMARNAGVDAIGVTTGIHTRELLEKSQPRHIVGSLDEVTPLILNGKAS
jgi:phosphoglycolate phosphatase